MAFKSNCTPKAQACPRKILFYFLCQQGMRYVGPRTVHKDIFSDKYQGSIARVKIQIFLIFWKIFETEVQIQGASNNSFPSRGMTWIRFAHAPAWSPFVPSCIVPVQNLYLDTHHFLKHVFHNHTTSLLKKDVLHK